MKRKLGVRTRLLAAVVLAVSFATALLVGAFNVLLAARLSADATAGARASAEATVGALVVRSGRIVPSEGPDAAVVGGLVWVFGPGGRTLEAPRTEKGLREAAATLARDGTTTRAFAGLGARLYAVPVVSANRRLGTVVAAVSTKPYDQTRAAALIASLALAAGFLAAFTLAARWMLRAALQPVTEMTASAASWSEHDPERRFQRGAPYDELTELAATLDALLARLAASLRREQRFAAELSHELRTPLARISGEAELALEREREGSEYRDAFASVYRDARQMGRTVEALMAAARQEAGLARATCDVGEAASRSLEAATPLAESRHIEITISQPRTPLRTAVESELIERILQPLLENACQYGRARVEMIVALDGGTPSIHVKDDGPGVSAGEEARIFDAGVRGRAADGRGSGSGLGLALAQRLARSAGGTITVRAGARGGHFVVELPRNENARRARLPGR